MYEMSLKHLMSIFHVKWFVDVSLTTFMNRDLSCLGITSGKSIFLHFGVQNLSLFCNKFAVWCCLMQLPGVVGRKWRNVAINGLCGNIDRALSKRFCVLFTGNLEFYRDVWRKSYLCAVIIALFAWAVRVVHAIECYHKMLLIAPIKHCLCVVFYFPS